MRIGIFGLGYVGTVTAASLASSGHEVIGVDLNATKVDMVNRGQSPVIEPDLDDLIRDGVESGRLKATTDHTGVVESTDLSLICVGTPSRQNGSLDLSHVESVAGQVGRGLKDHAGYHVVVVRSTMLPGSTQDVVVPALEKASGRSAGVDFGICYNPEFLREGSSVKDYRNPPFTVLGADDDSAPEFVAPIYADIEAETLVVPTRVAEMVKYVSNAFHALKIGFANEIGNICSALGVDSHQVMDVFVRDRKLNISDAYLRPGFAFGGSCLPKDVRALTYQGRRLDVPSPVLESIMPSNELQIEHALQLILGLPHKRVGVMGMSFKANTDDLRESPVVELIERLIGKGYDVRVYDKNVSLANLQGANRTYIESEIPHIASLMTESLESLVAGSEVLVVGNADPEFETAIKMAREDQVVVDLVRLVDRAATDAAYLGISW